MSNINLTWTPGSGGTQQIGLKKPKTLTLAPFNSNNFVPSSPFSSSQSTATSQNLLDNLIYQFKIVNECSSEQQESNLYEQLVFTCKPITFEVRTPTSLYCQVYLPTHILVDGVLDKDRLSDITNVEFYLYDSTNTILLQGPLQGVVETVVNNASQNDTKQFSGVVFSGLTPGQTYTIRFNFITTINSTIVRSSETLYLSNFCSSQITIPTINQTGNFTITNSLILGSLGIIEEAPNLFNYYSITSGSIPVNPTQQVLGTHSAFSGRIPIVVSTDGSLNLILNLFVNAILVETIVLDNSTANETMYLFSDRDYLAIDNIQIVLDFTA